MQDAFNANVCVAGHVNVGPVLSTRFTVNVQYDVLPLPSFAVRVTVVFPMLLTMVPGAGDWVTVMEPDAVQLSLFVASER